jgi:transcription elongation factor S-II
MSMDAAALSAAIKEMQEANAAGKSDDVVALLKKFKTDVVATEDLLRQSRAGIAIGKLRSHATPAISALAKDVVKLWKEQVDENKRKRKRDDDGAPDAKKAKAGSPAKSPAVKSPSSKPASKGKEEKKEGSGADGEREKSKTPETLVTIEHGRTTPRTAKGDGVDKSLKSDNSEAASEDVRDRCVVMIYDALASDSNAQTKTLSQCAIAIERECCKLMNYDTGKAYRAKIRTLFLNLKDKGNPALRNEIVLGQMTADRVVRLTKEEMASESMKAMNERIQEQNLFNSKGVGEVQAETDSFKCGRCGQRKCVYFQMQTRSADEPMTTFVTCTVCGLRWKFS